MRTLRVSASSEYDVTIGENALNGLPDILANYQRVVVVTDDNVRCLAHTKAFLAALGNRAKVFTVTPGETSKSLPTYGKLLEFLAKNGVSRSDILVALGGGVVGDLAGFSAATYMRGIKYVQAPTTLLAMVDSSVGGKTAVNLDAGKNMAGCFYQPVAVIADTHFLRTLPNRELQNGTGEIIKYGAIRDAGIFELVSKKPLEPSEYEHIIAECVKIKSDIVKSDEFDNGERQLLNFGHTLGHVIERHSDYKISHGEGVGIGMTLITRFSEREGLTEVGTADKIATALNLYGMKSGYETPTEELFSRLRTDKKIRGDKITLALASKIGHAFLKDFKLTPEGIRQ